MRRVLLVGEDNPLSRDPRHALFPYPPMGAGGRLLKIMGVTMRAYLRDYQRVNLCAGEWDAEEAARYSGVVKWSEDVDVVVLLGRKVREAFGWDYPSFTTMLAKGKTFVFLPHPSGRCRVWNDPASLRRARRVLRKHGVIGSDDHSTKRQSPARVAGDRTRRAR